MNSKQLEAAGDTLDEAIDFHCETLIEDGGDAVGAHAVGLMANYDIP